MGVPTALPWVSATATINRGKWANGSADELESHLPARYKVRKAWRDTNPGGVAMLSLGKKVVPAGPSETPHLQPEGG